MYKEISVERCLSCPSWKTQAALYAVSAQIASTVAAAGNTARMPFSTVHLRSKRSKSRSSAISGLPVAALLCSLLFVCRIAVKVKGAIMIGRIVAASQV
jgi:hypothetical protein